MTNRTKIVITIFLIALTAVSTTLFLVLRERYVAEEIPVPEETPSRERSDESSFQAPDSENGAPEGEEAEITDEEADAEEDAPDEPVEFIEITGRDCSERCEDFSDKEEKRYCEEVCGLEPDNGSFHPEDDEDGFPEAPDASECDALSSLERDYCLKDAAIAGHDPSLCDRIEDAALLRTCRNRIAQELLESGN